MVNGWAYEYAAHAKPKAIRGQWKTVQELDDGGVISKKLSHGVKGGMSEVAFHLLHYPVSLLATHWSEFKGGMKALKAKQGMDSEEIQYGMRYAGVAGLIGLVSVFTNTNLFNIFENETVERVNRIVSDFTDAESDEKGTFGLLSEFTGPTIGTLKYMMIVGGILDVDHSTLQKILFGNVDFADPDDKLSEMYKSYQYSTEWGVIKNKLYPSSMRKI